MLLLSMIIGSSSHLCWLCTQRQRRCQQWGNETELMQEGFCVFLNITVFVCFGPYHSCSTHGQYSKRRIGSSWIWRRRSLSWRLRWVGQRSLTLQRTCSPLQVAITMTLKFLYKQPFFTFDCFTICDVITTNLILPLYADTPNVTH